MEILVLCTESHTQGRGEEVGQETGQGADKVCWLGVPVGSLVLDHRSWRRIMNQTGCSDRATRVEAAFVARSWGREASAVCRLPGWRDGRLEHPGALLVPNPGPQASAATCCSLMAQVRYGNGLRNSRKESPEEIQQE